MVLTYEQFQSILKTNHVVVEFTKTDGSQRIMRCTLNPKDLPANEGPKKAKQETSEHTSVSVWDLDVEGWRSFRLDSVYAVHLLVEASA